MLRTGINLGISGALVWGFGADYISADDLSTITYAMARPSPDAETLEPRTRDVPVAWHESLRLAFEAQEKIRQAGLSPLVGSFIVPGSFDDPEASLSVDATEEGIAQTLEELTDGIPVEVNLVDDIPPQSGQEFDASDAHRLGAPFGGDIPGGVACVAGDNHGTLTSAMFDAETGERFFSTSNHVFGARGAKTTEHRGRRLIVPSADDQELPVGNVAEGYPAADVVRVAPAGEYRPTTVIDRASPSRVIGQYTKVGLAALAARDEPLTKVGALSDWSSGPIKGVDGITCYTGTVCKSGQLKWGNEEVVVDGDSGSLNFHPDPEHPDDYLLVGGINNARTWWPGSNFAWGTAAHHLLDEYGLHF